MKTIITIFCLLISPLVFSNSIGTVLFTAKKVVAQPLGTEVNLTRGSQLFSGDTIITSEGAVAKIRYLNGTLLTIGSNSTYTVLSYKPEQSEVLNAQLVKGKIESQSVGGPKQETLTTPVVAIKVSGTYFRAYVSGPKKTNVELKEGNIKVGNVDLKPGDSVVATPYGISPQPFPEAGTIPTTPELRAVGESQSSNETTHQKPANTANNAFFSNAFTVGEEVINNSTSLASVHIPPTPPLPQPPPNPQGSIQVICPPY